MSTETQKVDVLAVLDSEIADLAGTSWSDDANERVHRKRERQLRKARAAVAELIEALEISQAYVDDAALFPEQFKPGVVKRHAAKVRAALARVGGAA